MAKGRVDEELDLVYNSIDDYIFETHKFCSKTEIMEITMLSRKKCDQLLLKLIQTGKIKEVYGGEKKVRIYIPSYMLAEILAAQVKPRWVDGYSFEEKKEKIEEINTLKDGIKQFEMFERLIYTTNTPLEEAVAFAFKFLGFKSVKHLKDPEYHDVEFKFNNKLYLVEVKGKGKHGTKKDVLQLGGWIAKKLDEDMKRNELEGLFVINHYRKEDPTKRENSLTEKAKEYLNLYDSKFIETVHLYELIRNVLDNEITKEEARSEIIKGH